jgi:hypothetical protein
MSRNEWPEETRLLEQLRAAGNFTLYAFGDRTHPLAIAATRSAPLVADAVIIRDRFRVAAFRTTEADDPLHATTAVWYWMGNTVDTLRALYTLPGAMGESFPLPAGCLIPEADWRPYTMRPPQ